MGRARQHTAHATSLSRHGGHLNAADILERDAFANLFGSGRGVPGSVREPFAFTSPPTALLHALGVSALPAGLTLVVGDKLFPRSVASAAFATTLADSGQRVAYLACDDDASKDIEGLLAAQSPSGPPIAYAHAAGGFALTAAKAYVEHRTDTGRVQVVVIDALNAAFAAAANIRDFERGVRVLAACARARQMTVIAACAPALLTPPHSGLQAELLLHARATPSSSPGICEIHCPATSRQVRLRFAKTGWGLVLA